MTLPIEQLSIGDDELEWLRQQGQAELDFAVPRAEQDLLDPLAIPQVLITNKDLLHRSALCRLVSLNLSRCELGRVPACLRVFSCLQELNLSGNNLRRIPAGFLTHYLPFLKILDLSDNFLGTLQDITGLCALEDLEVLNLRGNPLPLIAHRVDLLSVLLFTPARRLIARHRESVEDCPFSAFLSLGSFRTVAGEEFPQAIGRALRADDFLRRSGRPLDYSQLCKKTYRSLDLPVAKKRLFDGSVFTLDDESAEGIVIQGPGCVLTKDLRLEAPFVYVGPRDADFSTFDNCLGNSAVYAATLQALEQFDPSLGNKESATNVKVPTRLLKASFFGSMAFSYHLPLRAQRLAASQRGPSSTAELIAHTAAKDTRIVSTASYGQMELMGIDPGAMLPSKAEAVLRARTSETHFLINLKQRRIDRPGVSFARLRVLDGAVITVDEYDRARKLWLGRQVESESLGASSAAPGRTRVSSGRISNPSSRRPVLRGSRARSASLRSGTGLGGPPSEVLKERRALARMESAQRESAKKLDQRVADFVATGKLEESDDFDIHKVLEAYDNEDDYYRDVDYKTEVILADTPGFRGADGIPSSAGKVDVDRVIDRIQEIEASQKKTLDAYDRVDNSLAVSDLASKATPKTATGGSSAVTPASSEAHARTTRPRPRALQIMTSASLTGSRPEARLKRGSLTPKAPLTPTERLLGSGKPQMPTNSQMSTNPGKTRRSDILATGQSEGQSGIGAKPSKETGVSGEPFGSQSRTARVTRTEERSANSLGSESGGYDHPSSRPRTPKPTHPLAQARLGQSLSLSDLQKDSTDEELYKSLVLLTPSSRVTHRDYSIAKAGAQLGVAGGIRPGHEAQNDDPTAGAKEAAFESILLLNSTSAAPKRRPTVMEQLKSQTALGNTRAAYGEEGDDNSPREPTVTGLAASVGGIIFSTGLKSTIDVDADDALGVRTAKVGRTPVDIIMEDPGPLKAAAESLRVDGAASLSVLSQPPPTPPRTQTDLYKECAEASVANNPLPLDSRFMSYAIASKPQYPKAFLGPLVTEDKRAEMFEPSDEESSKKGSEGGSEGGSGTGKTPPLSASAASPFKAADGPLTRSHIPVREVQRQEERILALCTPAFEDFIEQEYLQQRKADDRMFALAASRIDQRTRQSLMSRAAQVAIPVSVAGGIDREAMATVGTSPGLNGSFDGFPAQMRGESFEKAGSGFNGAGRQMVVHNRHSVLLDVARVGDRIRNYKGPGRVGAGVLEAPDRILLSRARSAVGPSGERRKDSHGIPIKLQTTAASQRSTSSAVARQKVISFTPSEITERIDSMVARGRIAAQKDRYESATPAQGVVTQQVSALGSAASQVAREQAGAELLRQSNARLVDAARRKALLEHKQVLREIRDNQLEMYTEERLDPTLAVYVAEQKRANALIRKNELLSKNSDAHTQVALQPTNTRLRYGTLSSPDLGQGVDTSTGAHVAPLDVPVLEESVAHAASLKLNALDVISLGADMMQEVPKTLKELRTLSSDFIKGEVGWDEMVQDPIYRLTRPPAFSVSKPTGDEVVAKYRDQESKRRGLLKMTASGRYLDGIMEVMAENCDSGRGNDGIIRALDGLEPEAPQRTIDGFRSPMTSRASSRRSSPSPGSRGKSDGQSSTTRRSLRSPLQTPTNGGLRTPTSSARTAYRSSGVIASLGPEVCVDERLAQFGRSPSRQLADTGRQLVRSLTEEVGCPRELI